MKKSLTKQIEELKVELVRAETVASGYLGRARTAEEELEKKRRDEIMVMNNRYERERDKSEVLFEVVRWLINPDLAKDPFSEVARQEKEKRFN
jgi:hypothetical protein